MDVNQVGDRGGCKVHTKAGLVTGGDASNITINTANVINFTVDGVMYAKAILNNVAFSSGHTALAAGQECIFGVWVNSGGNVSTTQGKIVATADLSVASGGTGKTVVPMPDVISANALIGLIKVKTAGAAVFTPGTTAFNATNVTATFYDTSSMPTAPLAS